jgi:hypothetical protein
MGMRTIGRGALLGLLLFLIQNTAVWSGWLRTPGGAAPAFHLINPDTCQYLGFLALARDHFLFPNLQAPWITEPAMLNVLFLTGGRLGAWLHLTPVATLIALELLLYGFAASALVWVLDVFLETPAQKIGAVIATVCSMPLLAWLFTSRISLIGSVDLTYMTADGLFRGGLSNSPTLSFGTGMVLVELGLAALRFKKGRPVYSYWLAAAVFLSALVHPFEVFVTIPAVTAGFALFARKAWREALLIATSAGLGVTPHAVLALRHPWLGELARVFSDSDPSLAALIFSYGLGLLAVAYLLLMRSWPRSIQDKLLLVWWLTAIAIQLLPGVKVPQHLMDGFAVLTGILVVRLAAPQAKLNELYQRHRRAWITASACVLIVGTGAYARIYAQIANDGRSTDPSFLLPAVASTDEIAVLYEMRNRANVDDLVMAPAPLSLLLITVPMHSFASHEHLSMTYRTQFAESSRFFEGKMTSAESQAFLAQYGFRWVVMPENSAALKYFENRHEAFRAGRLRVFELPENHMLPYPGLRRLGETT